MVSPDLTAWILVAGFIAVLLLFQALLFQTMRAGPGDLDHGQFRRKARGARGGAEALRHRRCWNFADRTAGFADQKNHHRGSVMLMRAGEIRVAAFDAVNETV